MEPIDNNGLTDSGVIEDQRINYQWGIACSILSEMCQYYNSCDNSRWSYRWLSARLQELQFTNNGVTAVLAIDIYWIYLCSLGRSNWTSNLHSAEQTLKLSHVIDTTLTYYPPS